MKTLSPNFNTQNNNDSKNEHLDHIPFIKKECYQSRAQQQAMTNFINCYLREFAIPQQEVSFNYTKEDLPICLKYKDTDLITIYLPKRSSQDYFEQDITKIVVPVQCISKLGKCIVSGSPWLKTSNHPWQCLTIEQLIDNIHYYLSERYQVDINEDLRGQIFNSISITQSFLSTIDCHNNFPPEYNKFISSEQSLVWGHAYHPSPKSREGIMLPFLLSHSPETRSKFTLFWFKIDPILISTMGEMSLDTLREIAKSLLEDCSGFNPQDDDIYYPCHPWEVEAILTNELIQTAINTGYITPLGFIGKTIYPTSSVRTLYSPELSHFMKFSIHVRMTNCIRKNAWYELQSAIFLTEVLESIYREKLLTTPSFKLLLEPVATTIDISSIYPEASKESKQVIQETFGILFRQSFNTEEITSLGPQVAASLFTQDNLGQSVIALHLYKIINSQTSTTRKKDCHKNYCELACIWLESYANILITGSFDYFFNHGVVFELHLQNVIIGMSHGLPICIWVRDMEGTKLVESLCSFDYSSGPNLSELGRKSLTYSRDKGWSRVAYCVLINNISEAIFYLCRDPKQGKYLASLEDRLWEIVENILKKWQIIYGVQPEIQNLLEGGNIPSKTNYKTRLMSLADKYSSYVMLPCPWSSSLLNTDEHSLDINTSISTINTEEIM